jgi:DNA sulfur modification protein DndD
MKILSLKLTNFMSYKGTHEINFDVPDASPVILFLGENGHGKTTIQHAARWCLYGETNYKERKIPLFDLLNRKSYEAAPAASEVDMEVVLEWEDSKRNYELTRTWSVKKDSSGWVTGSATPSLRIDHKNPVPTTAIPEYVQRFLAKEISHFFFFNGEIQDEFDKMTSNDDGASFIKSEIEKTLSIPVITEAINWLHGKESSESTAIEKANRDNAKIAQYAFDKEQALKEKTVLENELKIQMEKREKARTAIAELNKKIGNIEEVQGLTASLNIETGKIDAITSQRREIISNIKDHLSTNVWLPNSKYLLKVWKTAQDSKNEYEKAEESARSYLRNIELLSELEYSATCPLCNSVHDNTPESVKNRKIDLQKKLDEVSGKYDLGFQGVMELLSLMGFETMKVSKAIDLQKEYDELGARLAKAKNAATEVRNRLSLHGNVDVKESMVNMRAFTQNEEEATRSINSYQEDIKKKASLIESLESAISKGGTVSPEKQAAYNAFRYLRFLFTSGKESYANLVRQQVETFASESFNSIISDKKFVGLKINDSYGVDLLMKDGKIEPLRSTGQAKISAISLINGLIKTAMPEGFILMDTPFGSLDMGHRREVCKWASNSGLKVSLFMHSGEFDRNIDSEFFGNGIGRIYRIHKVDDNESSISVEV